MEPSKKRKLAEPVEQVVIEQSMTIDVRDHWTTIAQHALIEYIQSSPLKSVSEQIKPDHYKGFTPFLIEEIIRLATPHYGIGLSLKTIVDALDMVCKEACLLIGRQERFGEDYKKPRPITVYVEHLPLPSVSPILEEEDPDRWLTLPLGLRQILTYDRDRQWLAQYRELGFPEMNVFSVRIGESTHLLSMLIPCCVLQYSWRMEKNDYLTSYEMLLHDHQTNLFQLHSIQRIAKNNAQINAAVRLDELNHLKREISRLNQSTPSKEVIARQEEQANLIDTLLKQNATLQLRMEATRERYEDTEQVSRMAKRIESLEQTNKKLKNTMLNHGLLKSKGANKATVQTNSDLFASLRNAAKANGLSITDYEDELEEDYEVSLST